MSRAGTLDKAGPATGRFLGEVLDGLRRPRKRLPCKYFYDDRGSQLFDRICELDEYYPTRTELAIMRRHAGEMTELLGRRCRLIELGSGSSTKTELLLDQLKEPAGYVPVEISRECLARASHRLREKYPGLKVLPLFADFTRVAALPLPQRQSLRTVIYFPGSTIGNFPPRHALRLLRRLARLGGSGGGLLIGVDLKKDPQVLHAAYNDAAGVTARFNQNVLVRCNRELGSNFAVERFAHYAFYHPLKGRIEMHLVSREDQAVEVADERIALRQGESILTEYSYKYTIPEFAALADAAGYRLESTWTDEREWFSVQYYLSAS